ARPGVPRVLVARRGRSAGEAPRVRQIGQRPEELLILPAISGAQHPGDLHPGEVVFQWILDRPERLGPQTVRAPVPELPWRVDRLRDRHGPPGAGGDAVAGRDRIGEAVLR